jgi:hypothetical protein
MDNKKVFEKLEKEAVFVKTVDKPAIEGSQKAALNRKGNMLFSQGDIEGAKRVFLTTGYSDGLIRVGDQYKSQGKVLDALKMYWIAPDKKRAETIIADLSGIIQKMISENEVENDNG